MYNQGILVSIIENFIYQYQVEVFNQRLKLALVLENDFSGAIH